MPKIIKYGFIHAKKMNKPKMIIRSTGAIGDTIMLIPLISGLKGQGYEVGVATKKMCFPLLRACDVKLYGQDEIFEGSEVIDISTYFDNLPHLSRLPLDFTDEDEERLGHLCEWQACSFYQKTGIVVRPSKDDVKICLTKEEVEYGLKVIKSISEKNNNKPIVIIAPHAMTKNRNIPKGTLENLVREISLFGVPCILEPFKKGIKGAVYVGHDDLIYASAILYAADAFVCVDSGPLHLINAVLQGTPDYPSLDSRRDKRKVVLVCGSANPLVVAYEDNRVVQSGLPCGIKSPCGAFGYAPKGIENIWKKNFGKSFFLGDDNSGCVYGTYSLIETAPCMESISPEQIILAVKDILTIP